MARKSKDNKKKKDNFVEFEFDGKEFKYSGRLYPESQTGTKKCTITPMSLTLNGVITIKGCRLMQTKDNTWINFPSWKDKKDEYQSYVYVDKDFSEEELDSAAEAAEKALEESDD